MRQSILLAPSSQDCVQEYDNGGSTPTVENIRGSDYGGGVGGILYTIRPDTGASFTHENKRGDVVLKTDGSGNATYQAQYAAFGQQVATSGATLDRQKSNSKDTDPSGLVDEGFRYRDLDTGMFITRDPAGFVDGPNLYTYVRQNPWTSFDPEGLEDVTGKTYAQLDESNHKKSQLAEQQYQAYLKMPKGDARIRAVRELEQTVHDTQDSYQAKQTINEMVSEYNLFAKATNGAPITESQRDNITYGQGAQWAALQSFHMGVQGSITAVSYPVGGIVAKPIGLLAGAVFKAFSKPAIEESAHSIISNVAQQQANKGATQLLAERFMTRNQYNAYIANPTANSRFLGTAVHNATDSALQSAHPGRFTYNTVGPDFSDALTGKSIELTTPSQVGAHLAKGGAYTLADYATYLLP